MTFTSISQNTSTVNFLRKVTMKLIAAKAINTPAIVILGMFLAAFMSLNAFAKENIADVAVKDAWVRTTVPGQKASGAFMTITSKADLKLVGASSPVAGVTEVHEMKMSGDVMQMRAITSLDLPAGKAVALRPGGLHVMLLDLKAALPKDSTVPLTLMFKDAKGVSSQLEVMLPVAVAAPGGAAMPANQHKH
jgi:periplasmic copper chaperone A